jgi:hypothetical protein
MPNDPDYINSVIDQVDDGEWLTGLFAITERELPAPKPKQKRKRST